MKQRRKGINYAKVIKVIETKSLRGSGTEKDPCRIVTQYWDFKGNLLAEADQETKETEQFPTLFPFALIAWLHQYL